MKKEVSIDINADLGEGSGNDLAIMPLISSCSIACGGHFGNENTIRNTIRLAKKHNVLIGAHPSFPDTDNFGRSVMAISNKDLYESISEQLKAFEAVCISENVQIHHIKCHGALYNLAAKDPAVAKLVVHAIQQTGIKAILYTLPNSELAKAASGNLEVYAEAFIDRRYNNDMSLVARGVKGAVIDSPEAAFEQLKQMVWQQKVCTITDEVKPISAQTFCIHGDHDQSVVILTSIHESMPKHLIRLNR